MSLFRRFWDTFWGRVALHNMLQKLQLLVEPRAGDLINGRGRSSRQKIHQTLVIFVGPQFAVFDVIRDHPKSFHRTYSTEWRAGVVMVLREKILVAELCANSDKPLGFLAEHANPQII
jgi:hypothetical protein